MHGAVACAMSASRAVTLDAMLAELARHSAMNMGDHINSSEH